MPRTKTATAARCHVKAYPLTLKRIFGANTRHVFDEYMIEMGKRGVILLEALLSCRLLPSAIPFLASTIGMNMMIAAAALTHAIAIPTHSP